MSTLATMIILILQIIVIPPLPTTTGHYWRAIADGVIKQSADLQNVVPNTRKGRPSKLKSNNNNTTATINNKQRKRNLVDELLPSTSKLTSIVVDRVTISLGSDDKLIESDEDLSLIAGIMKLKKGRKDSI